MKRGTRITMTKAQAESPTGAKLLSIIVDMCHDGRLTIQEVEDLHVFLGRASDSMPAIPFLRAITRELVADGIASDAEAHRLKLAFIRVVPKDIRGVIDTHLADVGVPPSDSAQAAWREDGATSKQIKYIIALGGQPPTELTKGAASDMIEGLLERTPPTPRQRMLIRFFDRLDLLQATKSDVSLWIDELFTVHHRHEMAWERYKREARQDPHSFDADTVPIGAYRHYMTVRQWWKFWRR